MILSAEFWIAVVKVVIVLGGMLTAAAYLVLVERWIAAWIQDRRGPNRAGLPLTKLRLFGLGQPIADGVKFICKEDFTPSHVDKFLFYMGPVTIFVAAIAVFAVIPFGSVLPLPGLREPINLIIAPGLDVGVVFVTALSSVSVYGVILGGWSSNNKYGFFGALRASAQLISYEIPAGMALLGVVLSAGALRLDTIILQQAGSGAWNVLVQPLGFVVFVVAGFAEAGRLPFDLTEAEQELVGGYHTEYSGIKLMMYLTSEFIHMISGAFLITVFYLGGWHFWGLTGAAEAVSLPIALLRIVVLLGKVLGVIFIFMLVRWSWPRFRFDQLMGLAWNVMLPMALVNVVLVAVWVEYGAGIAARLGISSSLLEAAFGWTVLLVSWLIATLLVPAASDNRPRPGPSQLQTELEEIAQG